jgi:Rrf2 family protein
VRFTTKTEYGLVCLIHLAKSFPDNLVAIKDIVKEEQFSTTYIEKILQRLRSENIVISFQGNQGGYTLARPPSKITLKEIVDALEGGTFDIFCDPETRSDIVCTHFAMCKLTPIWKKTKALLDNYYSSLTLEAIAKDSESAGAKLAKTK